MVELGCELRRFDSQAYIVNRNAILSRRPPEQPVPFKGGGTGHSVRMFAEALAVGIW